jgi:hypothetical protein
MRGKLQARASSRRKFAGRHDHDKRLDVLACRSEPVERCLASDDVSEEALEIIAETFGTRFVRHASGEADSEQYFAAVEQDERFACAVDLVVRL